MPAVRQVVSVEDTTHVLPLSHPVITLESK